MSPPISLFPILRPKRPCPNSRRNPQARSRIESSMRSAKIKLSLDPQLTQPQTWSNPVVPGDHPDPTIVRVGKSYWASCTSGEWSPQFPLYHSPDLVQWRPAGFVFPVQPAWAEGSFWAPELVHDELSDQFLLWYVAKKRGGPLSVAVATASSASGPYTDMGPLISQEDGSIDPCFARDEHGEPYLIWKEDGNSANRPTPIWAQPLTEDLLRLTGEKTLLITNDQPWEEGVVEGQYILRRRGWFYMFYAGNTCCGRSCKYAEGVARSQKLLGPWEKFPGNPLIGANDNWRCPGHGTAVRTQGRKGKPGSDYLLYHAYPVGATVYVGREAVLDEITWSTPGPDGDPGWPVINSGKGPGAPAPTSSLVPSINFQDDFTSPKLGSAWHWPVNTLPDISTGNGALRLHIPVEHQISDRPVESAMLALPRPSGIRYHATVTVDVPEKPDMTLWFGLAIVGDAFNTVGLGLRGDQLILWQRRGNMQSAVWQGSVPDSERIHLRSTSLATEKCLQFLYSVDGIDWIPAGEAYDGSDLPAWDRGLRIALMLEGPLGRSATFRNFELCTE